MCLEIGSQLFVRVDYAVEGTKMNDQDLQDHLNYVRIVANERSFAGGGFHNVNGGMCLFEAENMEEAKKITSKDPIIEKGFYRCELFNWEVFVLSDNSDK